MRIKSGKNDLLSTAEYWCAESGYEYVPPSQPVLQEIMAFSRNAKSRILKKIKLFDDVVFGFTALNDGEIGKYIAGTHLGRPLIMIAHDLDTTADQEGVSIRCAVWTTIAHELAHAIEERLELDHDEDRAEDFARQLWDNKSIDMDIFYTTTSRAEDFGI